MAFLLRRKQSFWTSYICCPSQSASHLGSLQVCRLHSNSRTHYDVLGVDRNASKADIRAAFIKLSKKHHPDISKSSHANKHFSDINEAYSVLISPSKRYQYDSQLYTVESRSSQQQYYTSGRPFGGYYPGASMYDYSRNYEYHTLTEEEWNKLYNQSMRRPNHSRVIKWLLVMMMIATAVHSLRIGYAHKQYQERSDRETRKNLEIYNSIRERAKTSTLEEHFERLSKHSETMGRRT